MNRMIPIARICFIASLGLAFIHQACRENKSLSLDSLEQNLVWAGPNRPELEKVLLHYKQTAADSLQYKAAIFLISNMESKGEYGGPWLERFDSLFQLISTARNDIEINQIKDSILNRIGRQENGALIFQNDLRRLTAHFLIRNIDTAFRDWQQSPWASQVSFKTFCNYILPYKVLNEPRDSAWRSTLKISLQKEYNNPLIPLAMEDLCCEITESQRTWFRYTEVFSDYPSILSLKNILQGQFGACGEMAVLGAYTNRAFGIPVAIDYAPQWGNHTNGHIWNALILDEDFSLPFLGAQSRPGDYTDIRESEGKIAKVYRYQYGSNESSFAARARIKGIIEIPTYLKNPRIIDVTSLYVPSKEIILNMEENKDSPVYLCVFQSGEWEAIAGSWIDHGVVRFDKMGPEVLYMPMYFKANKYEQASAPVIIKINDSLKVIRPQTNKKITRTLYRKYPVKKARARFTLAEALIGAKFEASNTPDFRNPQIIFTIPEPIEKYKNKVIRGYTIRDELDYSSLWETAAIPNNHPFRYVRLVNKPKSTFRVGDLAFYNKEDTTALKGNPIGNVTHPEWAFDGWDGFSIQEENQEDINRWVGLDLGKPNIITQIRYLPANDRNTVIPGKSYEFFYWKTRWISLGTQIAKTHHLIYHEVPEGTIYWLHCKDCNSTEERPFTFEEEKQIWW